MPGLRRRIDRSRSTKDKEESVNPDVTSEERESASAVGVGTAAATEDVHGLKDSSSDEEITTKVSAHHSLPGVFWCFATVCLQLCLSST
jgi:hypothetical protein